MTSDVKTGGCLCGRVRFRAEGPPARIGICHCQDCRRHHGAAFYAAAIYPEGSVSVAGAVNQYQGRHFCPHCGSSVFARSGAEVELHLGAMDDGGDLVPDYEVWTIRRFPWLAPVAGTRQHDRDR